LRELAERRSFGGRNTGIMRARGRSDAKRNAGILTPAPRKKRVPALSVPAVMRVDGKNFGRPSAAVFD
jgi:hypothetical protein